MKFTKFTKFISSLFLLIFSFGFPQNIAFDDYFEQKSLRIDFLLYGTHNESNAAIHQLKKEPHFGGGTSGQLIFPNLGNYRILAKDKATGIVLFSKGFNPIFDEWKATEEAKTTTRTFENSMQIPFPKKEITVEIQHRNFAGTFETLLSKNINPKDYNIVNEQPTPFAVTEIMKNGAPKHKVDIAIIAEGYTADEMPKFLIDTRRLLGYMFTIPPFDIYKKDFNIYAIHSPSQESGTDIPGEEIFRNTILNSKFYTFGEPRYLTTMSNFKIADIAANVPYDQVYIIVNTPRYGGGGFYNTMNLVSADDRLSDKVFVHEFGHGFVGLADEYYNATTGGTDYYNLNIEPWEPNISTLVDFDKKWKKMVKKSTPIPTPRIAKYENLVGVFEGGGYTEKGIYSPVQDCRMKSNEPDGFCPVCSAAIDKTIEFYKR